MLNDVWYQSDLTEMEGPFQTVNLIFTWVSRLVRRDTHLLSEWLWNYPIHKRVRTNKYSTLR